MNDIRTFHEMLDIIVSSFDSEKAISKRGAEGWTATSTKSFFQQIKHLSLGLKNIGIQKGQNLGIMGRPSPDWIIADLAIMSIGAVTVPFFPDEPSDTVLYKIIDADLTGIFILDGEAHAEIKNHEHDVKFLIAKETPNADFLDINDVIEKGKEQDKKDPSLFDKLGKNIHPDDLSTIYYTSGSTGRPKGVELTHGNITSQIIAASKRIPLKATDRALSCLPMAHSFERFIVYYYLASNVPVYFNSDIHELGKDLQDICPTVITAVPRILEKFYDKFHGKIENAPWPRKQIGRMAIKWAYERKPESDSAGWRGVTASALVFSKLRKALGGGLRVMITGGAAMPPDLYRFFINAGVPVLQGYGMTEASPVLSANAPDAHEIGTVGLPFPGVEVAISDEGEIIAKGPNIMRGYHNRPEETEATIDNNGWLHTGDMGFINSNGFLTITGRKKEIFKTSCGEYVAPTTIEQKLCKSTLIDMAMVIGEGRPFVSCLIFPDPERSKGNGYERRIQKIVETTNLLLEHWEQIREFRIINDQLSVNNGMLTPTMKIKRHKVAE
ncbi:hypothetical protein BVX94_03480, partial [bacterium B17]